MYNEKVMELFSNPHNVGKLKGANAIGKVGNVSCGDIMKIYLKIDKNNIILDSSFETFGCAAAIVSSSVATDLVKGKTIDEALKIENQQIIDILGGLPNHKIHCSVLAKEAIEDAISNFRKALTKGKVKFEEDNKKSPKPKATVKIDLKKENKVQDKTAKLSLSINNLKSDKAPKKLSGLANKIKK